VSLGRPRVCGRGTRPEVGDLSQRAIGKGEGEQVVVGDVVDGPAVTGEDGVRLGSARVSQPARGHGAALDEVQVAAMADDAPAPVRREAAGREEDGDGIRCLVGDAFGCAPRRGHAVERGRFVPGLAAGLPLEVDPATVVRPADGTRLLADQFRPAHDAGHSQLEGLRLPQGLNRLRGLRPCRDLRCERHRGDEECQRDSRPPAILHSGSPAAGACPRLRGTRVSHQTRCRGPGRSGPCRNRGVPS
jgi:hypothetical protein